MNLRERIRAVLLSPSPPLFAMIWPVIAVFLYLSFLGDAGYLTYRDRKAELEHLQASIDDLKQEFRDLNDRFLYADETGSTRSEEIVLFKFENLSARTPASVDSISSSSIEKNRLFFLFLAVFIELAAVMLYLKRRKTSE
jgi:uncharacterized protein YecE (DUF72 family)